MNNKKVAFYGVGNMAGAIIRGLPACGIESGDIILYDKFKSQYDRFDGGYVRAETAAGIASADFIVVGVRPQDFTGALEEIKQSCPDLSSKVVVTFAAGKSIAAVEAVLGCVPIVRVMPNALMSLGKGVAELCRNSQVSDTDFGFVMAMFSASGYAAEVEESQINAFTALTSSSPAYVYLFVKSMAAAAEKMGVDRSDTVEMISRVLIGSAEMLMTSGKTPDELIGIVATHGGTTEKAVNVLLEEGFDRAIVDAVTACAERAAELGRG